MDSGILAFGAYIPRLRIDRAAIVAAHSWAFPGRKAKGARALAKWDEDPITMGVEAARGLDRSDVAQIAFASTNLPFADLQNATLVASALGLAEDVATLDLAGSVRAGSSALLSALRGGHGPSLVIAADARRARPGSVQELQYGAGAVAMKVGSGPDVVARLIGSASRAAPFVDHFRASGAAYDYFWEERWVRDAGYGELVPPAVAEALANAGVAAGDVAAFCLPALLGGVPASVARKCGIPAEAVCDDLQLDCGDSGAAQGLLMLAAALERAKPGDKLLLVTFGAGCDVLLFEATERISSYRPVSSVAATRAAGRVEPHYTKLLSFHGEISLDWGMRSEGGDKIPLTEQYRSRGQLGGFNAGECADCGAVQFPQLARCVNCGSFGDLAQRPLVDEPARVMSHTADWLQYSPSPPLYFGLVQFGNGARVMMELVDVDPETLGVGTPLRMVYRIKSLDKERGYRRYFWKAAPIAAGGE